MSDLHFLAILADMEQKRGRSKCGPTAKKENECRRAEKDQYQQVSTTANDIHVYEVEPPKNKSLGLKFKKR